MCLNKDIELLSEETPDKLPIKNILYDVIERAKVSFTEETMDKYVEQINDTVISIFQTSKNRSGRSFELGVQLLLDKFNIPYQSQVYINGGGMILGWDHDGLSKNDKKDMGIKPGSQKFKVDFVVGNDIQIGSYIHNCHIISCKKTLRERAKQDLPLNNKCRKFFLATLSSEGHKNTKVQLVSSKINKKNKNCIDYNEMLDLLDKEFNHSKNLRMI